jgi:hypothetical protein
MSEFMMQQIEQRMAQKGIDLNLLSDEELATVAVRFLGDAPPGHLPRETVISTLQDQKPIQEWAMGIKSRVAAQAAERMTDATRSAVDTARETYQKKRDEDPRLACDCQQVWRMVERIQLQRCSTHCYGRFRPRWHHKQ